MYKGNLKSSISENNAGKLKSTVNRKVLKQASRRLNISDWCDEYMRLGLLHDRAYIPQNVRGGQ